MVVGSSRSAPGSAGPMFHHGRETLRHMMEIKQPPNPSTRISSGHQRPDTVVCSRIRFRKPHPKSRNATPRITSRPKCLGKPPTSKRLAPTAADLIWQNRPSEQHEPNVVHRVQSENHRPLASPFFRCPRRRQSLRFCYSVYQLFPAVASPSWPSVWISSVVLSSSWSSGVLCILEFSQHFSTLQHLVQAVQMT